LSDVTEEEESQQGVNGFARPTDQTVCASILLDLDSCHANFDGDDERRSYVLKMLANFRRKIVHVTRHFRAPEST